MRLAHGDFNAAAFSFNPRICKRCDHSKLDALININVSIHASVKDATSGAYGRKKYYYVSIHASVKDATQRRLNLLCRKMFQSTHL